MPRNTDTTSLSINLADIDTSDLLSYVQRNYAPNDVFPESELSEWATGNGFVKSRYQVVKGSQSAHCCFEATVVDTTKPVMIGGKHYENQYESICECFEVEDANLIARALNG